MKGTCSLSDEMEKVTILSVYVSLMVCCLNNITNQIPTHMEHFGPYVRIIFNQLTGGGALQLVLHFTGWKTAVLYD